VVSSGLARIQEFFPGWGSNLAQNILPYNFPSTTCFKAKEKKREKKKTNKQTNKQTTTITTTKNPLKILFCGAGGGVFASHYFNHIPLPSSFSIYYVDGPTSFLE
jgi:hypothetical protein